MARLASSLLLSTAIRGADHVHGPLRTNQSSNKLLNDDPTSTASPCRPACCLPPRAPGGAVAGPCARSVCATMAGRASKNASAEHLIKVGQDQGIAPVVDLLRSAEETVQQGAAAALWSLSVTNENKIKIVERGGLPLLIRMLRSSDEGSQEQSSGCLYSLSVLAENKLNIVQEGGLAPLVGLLHSPNPEVAKQACGCIRNLAVSALNKEKILQEKVLNQPQKD